MSGITITDMTITSPATPHTATAIGGDFLGHGAWPLSRHNQGA
jgi:hypothetical protein